MTKKELEELKQLIRDNKYLVHGDPENADCVIGFSFGYRLDNEKIIPGKSNEQIAKLIKNKFPDKKLILQFEIADALLKKVEYVIEKDPNNNYLSSLDVIKKAKKIMDKNEFKKAIVVTHPGLESRNDYMCTAYGIETVAPEGLEAIEFDQRSEQFWTRNLEAWAKKEVLDTIDDKFNKGLLEKPLM